MGGFANDLSLKYFPVQFLTGQALHCTAGDIIYDITKVATLNNAARRQGRSQDLSTGSREFSS